MSPEDRLQLSHRTGLRPAGHSTDAVTQRMIRRKKYEYESLKF
jgi:hypothetical protein